MRRTLARCLSLTLVAGAALCSRAETVKDFVDAGKISHTGAEASYVDGELVLKWTKTDAPGTLRIDPALKVEAEVLVVGGGGAGGTMKAGTSQGAGGGGAGGVILLEDGERIQLPAADYTITVGAGGAAAEGNAAAAPGASGQPSTIARTDGAVAYAAAGGGGGGASSDGLPGGSGGGASRGFIGGSATASQGNAGGQNQAAPSNGGAGGGGFGTVGGDGKMAGGAGGSGFESDVGGVNASYAGGGGGGKTGNNSGGAGGSGVGGTGGSATADGAAGAAHTGSGGGGGGKGTLGGAGADGLVIVRIVGVYDTLVDCPAGPSLPWNGFEQVAFRESLAYTLGGTTAATKVGAYAFTVAPAAGFRWRDNNGTEERTVNWQIVSVVVDRPKVPDGHKEVSYDGADHNAGVPGHAGYAFTEASVTNGVHAKAYAFTAQLRNVADEEPRYVWKLDEGEDEANRLADFTDTWKILPVRVARPVVAEGLTYTGGEQVGVTLGAHQTLSSGVTSGTVATTYACKVVLDNPEGEADYVWDEDGSSGPYEFAWTISAASNAISDLSIVGWRAGAKPQEPHATARFGTVRYAYANRADAPAEEWVVTPPSAAGTWYVKAFVLATTNWAAAEDVLAFVVWDEPGSIFCDHVTLTLSGYAGTETLRNFPLPVRLSEVGLPGFEYARAGNGRQLGFILGDQMLDYEIDEWNPDGESLVWVRIPELTAATTLEIWWCLRPGQAAAGPDGSAVWSDYTGVWHMGEAITGATAATTKSADATGNGLDAAPDRGNVGDLTRMVSAAGVLGNARVIESASPGKWGNHLVVPNYDAFALGGQFVFSTWAKFDDYSSWPILVSRKANNTGATGWAVEHQQTNRRNLTVRGNAGGEFAATVFPREPKAIETYTHLLFVYNGTNVKVYANGDEAASGAIDGVTDNGRELYLGGGYTAGGTPEYSIRGKLDETRLRKGTLSADWIRAEYKSATDPAFVERSLVYRDGLKVNEWAVRPDVSPRSWDLSQGTPAFTVSLGRLREGAVKVGYYAASAPDVPLADLNGITEAGTYYAVFEMDDSTGYVPIRERLEVRVLNHAPITAIGGVDGDSGRVLLMNRDTNKECPIDRQGYKDTDASSSTYWMHLNATVPANATMKLQNGTESVLYKKGGTRLWHLKNCRHGNTFPAVASAPLNSSRNYLPWKSDTAWNFERRGQKATTRAAAGRIVMQNVVGAAVYSKFFEDGVGTIYFDAVNGWTDGEGETGENYKLRIEYATVTAGGDPATDENSAEGEDDWYGQLDGQWKPVGSVTLYKRDGTAEFVEEKVESNVFALAVRNGGTVDNFYRVAVTLNTQEPLRFRIVRETAVSSSIYGPDEGGLIVLDNLIVSYPPMRAELNPTGHYDDANALKRGATLLGHELATTVPFPAAGEANAFGRAVCTTFTNALDKAADPRTFVSAAKMHYRWRYLSQEVEDWKSVDLDPMNGFLSTKPLELPARQGDVEFWYDATLCAPFYKYVDYSGTGLGVPRSEEVAVMTNRQQAAGLPTGGKDWFFRLRSGASAWEGVNLVLTNVTEKGRASLSGTYPMELLEDDMWRALVPIKEEAEGFCDVLFVGLNRMAPGAEKLTGEKVVFGAAAAATNAVPSNGTCEDGGAPISFKIDHNANYYEIRFSTKFMTWSLARAEYQNFNHWHDAYAGLDTFKASFPTNGVNDVAMKTSALDMSGWKTFSGANDNWNEPFYLANSDDPGFPKEVVFNAHPTPNNWQGNNFTFVSAKLSSVADHSKPSDGAGSGIAAKLLGKGQGTLTFAKDNRPKGLDTVTASARLGQSITFNSFSYAPKALFEKDYTFFAPATMSQRTPQDGSQDGEMTVGASVSVVGYYFPSKGCYEFRVERVYSDKPIQLALYKWSADGESKRLCSMDWSGRYLWDNVDSNGNIQDSFFSLFMSLETTTDLNGNPVRTKIVCGRSDKAKQPATGADPAGTFGGVQHVGLVYVDADSPLSHGAYGVGSKDCPAEFVNPFHSLAPLFGDQLEDGDLKDTNQGSGKYFDGKRLSYPATGLVHDRPDIEKLWVLMPGSSEYYQYPGKPQWKGIRTPLNLSQKLELYLQPKAGGAYVKYGERVIAGYAFRDVSFPLHLTGEWNLQLRTGPANVDVALKGVRQVQWQAPDHENLDYRSDDYVYTQGVVGDVAGARAVTLQPSRGVATRPFSVRSPVLDGLGKVSFSYRDVREGAEVWLQMATNNVAYKLTGTDGYNQSVKSVEPGGPAPAGTWITIAKYTYDDLAGDTGRTKSQYLGLHNQPDSPVKGVFRLFVPPSVVTRAGIVATNATQNVDYGKITITGMTVSDEPGLSDRSWYGFNLRGIGDASDSEKRMYLMDTTLAGETGSGLDLALNNSLRGVAPDDVVRARAHYPAVISPTFKDSDTARSGVGKVSFKARLYSRTPETAARGRIILYGASNSVEGRWEPLQTNEVASSAFTDYSWESKGRTYKAVKLEVETPAAKVESAPLDVDRVILDEIVVGERIQPSISFAYVRPFRQDLMTTKAVEDILSPNEQPLSGESWGIQTKVSLQQLTDEIDPDSFEVAFCYYVGERPWGYENWKSAGSAKIPLTRATGTDELVFRSVGDNPDSLVEPLPASDSVVQYQVFVTYKDRKGTTYDPVTLERPADWERPYWYHPVDLNERHGYAESRPDLFSAYTILETVSPGRAWINEVNYNDGPLSENGGAPSVENQFIELCVPSGVDMTGWFLRLTDMNEQRWVMAKFGERLPATSTRSEVNGFAFVLLESPETNVAGGPKDSEGNRVLSDGVWSVDGIPGTAEKGTLSFNRPFQFELVRPSGVVEHQFVLGGTNTLAGKSYGWKYDATNLLAKLDASGRSPIRFLAGDEVARLDDKVRFASAGVVTGEVENAAMNPGRAATWSSKLVFTPGALNRTQDGALQTIPEDWFVMPNGTNAWVTLKVLGSHLEQSLGDDTASTIKFVLPQGATTNVTYTASPWYELRSLEVDGEEKAAHEARGGAPFVYTVAPTGRTCTVVATEGADSGLDGHLDPKNPYAPSVVSWLADRWPDRTPDEIKPAYAKELGEQSAESPLGLVDMYFLDIPPFAADAEEAAAEKIWWFRFGVTEPHHGTAVRKRTYTTATGPTDVWFTNVLIKAKLYISNDVSKVAYAPYRLQGLDYAKSDLFQGRWTSESFQVKLNLLNFLSNNEGFLPFRCFTFAPGSFTDAADPDPFTSKIEILDPFSTESPGFSYGWSRWPNTTGIGIKLSISTNAVPQTIERLKADSSYDGGF